MILWSFVLYLWRNLSWLNFILRRCLCVCSLQHLAGGIQTLSSWLSMSIIIVIMHINAIKIYNSTHLPSTLPHWTTGSNLSGLSLKTRLSLIFTSQFVYWCVTGCVESLLLKTRATVVDAIIFIWKGLLPSSHAIAKPLNKVWTGTGIWSCW